MGSVSVRQADVCVLCASCGSHQCCVMYYLQFVNARCKRERHMGEAYFRAGLIMHWIAMSVSFSLLNPVAVNAFIICRSVCVY